MALVKALFGEAAMKYMIILFTRKEELEDQSLSNFLEGSDGNLQSLLQECGDCCCAFDSSKNTEQAEKEAQVQELVELIDKMVQNNQGAYFSDPIYKDIDQKLRQQEEYLMKNYADTFNMQIEQVEVECAHKPPEEKMKKIKAITDKYNEQMKNVREEAEKSILQDVFNKIKNMLSKIWQMLWR